MKATPGEVKRYLAVISETPQRVADATAEFDDLQLHFKADSKSWSASDLLAHLRSCSDLWTHSIYAMLAENEPQFSDVDERKWARVTKYAGLDFFDSLEAFSLQRKNLVRVLHDLPFEAWERSALIVERRHTVFTQTRRMAKHESEHLQQLSSILRVAVQ